MSKFDQELLANGILEGTVPYQIKVESKQLLVKGRFLFEATIAFFEIDGALKFAMQQSQCLVSYAATIIGPNNEALVRTFHVR